MKHALAAYAVVLVVLLMVTREFEASGWRDVGALQISAAVVNSLLVLAVTAGVLLVGRLGLERWARSMARWRRKQAIQDGENVPEAEVVGVTSWRPAAAPSPPENFPAPIAAPPSPAGFTYVGPSYGHESRPVPPFPERPGPRI